MRLSKLGKVIDTLVIDLLSIGVSSVTVDTKD